jgi:hypothetical protein
MSFGNCVEETSSPGAVTFVGIENLRGAVHSLEADCVHLAARERVRGGAR